MHHGLRDDGRLWSWLGGVCEAEISKQFLPLLGLKLQHNKNPIIIMLIKSQEGQRPPT